MSTMANDKHHAAIQTLKSMGIDLSEDFHALRTSQVDSVLEMARAVKYSKSKGAPGSRARMYYQFLQRLARR
jgi:hypothetical protein